MGKRLFFLLAALAVLLLQLGNCMPAMAMNPQAMQCCRSMPCTPANRSQGCCKNMLSASAPSMLPGHHAALHGPAVVAIEYPIVSEILRYAPAPYSIIESPQHSPPDLYTLHASLLI
jgi:hypothetical protein